MRKSSMVVAVVFYDDLDDMRTHELLLSVGGIMQLNTYIGDRVAHSVSSLAGGLFIDELRGVLSNPGANVVFADHSDGGSPETLN